MANGTGRDGAIPPINHRQIDRHRPLSHLYACVRTYPCPPHGRHRPDPSRCPPSPPSGSGLGCVGPWTRGVRTCHASQRVGRDEQGRVLIGPSQTIHKNHVRTWIMVPNRRRRRPAQILPAVRNRRGRRLLHPPSPILPPLLPQPPPQRRPAAATATTNGAQTTPVLLRRPAPCLWLVLGMGRGGGHRPPLDDGPAGVAGHPGHA